MMNILYNIIILEPFMSFYMIYDYVTMTVILSHMSGKIKNN